MHGMGYPRRLLAQGERIEFEMRPHWRSMIIPSLVLVATVGVTSYLYAATPEGSADCSFFFSALRSFCRALRSLSLNEVPLVNLMKPITNSPG